jgi:hypothetical protein
MRVTTNKLVSWVVLGSCAMGAGCSAPVEHDEGIESVATSESALNASLPGAGSGVLWRKPNGDLVIWDMATVPTGASFLQKEFVLGVGVGFEWGVIATGDFNADGSSDLLWGKPINPMIYTLSLWGLSDTNFVGWTPESGSARRDARLLVGDRTGDGVSDLIWAYSVPGGPTGTMHIPEGWTMTSGSQTPSSTGSLFSSPSYHAVAVGNFDGDTGKRAEVLFRAVNSTGDARVLSGSTLLPIGLSAPFPAWTVKGVGDVNRDGKSDVLWFNMNTGEIQVWFMNGTFAASRVNLQAIPTSSGWTIQGVGDVNHDGASDILWRHTDGTFGAWLLRPVGSVIAYPSIAVPTNWWYSGILELPTPAVPSNPVVTRVNGNKGANATMVVEFDIPNGRPNDSILVREPPGTTTPGAGPFPMQVAYSQVSPGRGRVQLDASKFGARDRACLQIAMWEQGRVSAFSNTFCSPGLPPPPAAPMNFRIDKSLAATGVRGCSWNFPGELCLTYLYEDPNTNSINSIGCELWEVPTASGLGTTRHVIDDCGDGSRPGTMRREMAISRFVNTQRACLKIRLFNAGGFSAFSNVSCAGASAPPATSIGLGNGVLLCEGNTNTCNFSPRLNQDFHVEWAVCNAGSTSPAVSVELKQQDPPGVVTTPKTFSIAAGSLMPGNCMIQKSDVMKVTVQGDWRWTVVLNGAPAGSNGGPIWP